MFASQSAAMETVDWGADGAGVPLSPRFGEPYRSRSGALAQARGVFLRGCGLPGRWQGQADFGVLELGFGLGLNFLSTWAAWELDPHRSASLGYRAIEAWPVPATDIQRSARQAVDQALAQGMADPADRLLPDLAAALTRAWAGLHAGVQEWRLDAGRGAGPIRLCLVVGEVAAALALSSARQGAGADAVYLDGFSPAVNPHMWSEPVLQAVVSQAAPGARLATYTVAREVRERLTGLGLEVHRRDGLPPKRHRLEAWCRPAGG